MDAFPALKRQRADGRKPLLCGCVRVGDPHNQRKYVLSAVESRHHTNP